MNWCPINLRCLWLACVMCAVQACSDRHGNHDSPSGDDSTSGAALCDAESRAEAFVPGLGKRTDDGVLVTISEAEPTPPARSDNTWFLALVGSDGEPLTGAQLVLDAKMPDHGHGSPREAVITELGEGRYRAEPVALFMPGFWTIDVSVSVQDEPSGAVHFGFCVP
jgi:hypothetical protein